MYKWLKAEIYKFAEFYFFKLREKFVEKRKLQIVF